MGISSPSSIPGEGKTLIYPVFIPMVGCRTHCIYCDQYAISGVHSTDIKASVIDAVCFVHNHPGRDKQIAFYGGSFTALPQVERDGMLNSFDAIRDANTHYRISTHPKCIDADILAWCKRRDIRTIELGIQDFHADVLKATGRDYTSWQALQACELVRDMGFEMGVQLMPGLPGWDNESLNYNHAVLKKLRPNLLRIYPCVVLRGTPLEKLYRTGCFQPLTLDEAILQSADYQEEADEASIRLIKLGIPSNLDPDSVVAGPWHPAFGELVRGELLVRLLEAQYPAGSHILLTKKQHALLVAHGLYYLNILHKRIENCSVEVV